MGKEKSAGKGLTPRIIEVLWLDAHGVSDGGWIGVEALSNFQDSPSKVIHNIGYISDENKIYFTLVSGFDSDFDNFKAPIKIPKRSILKMRELKSRWAVRGL